MLAVILGAASPVLLGLVAISIPYSAWLSLFALMLAAMLGSVIASEHRGWSPALLALSVLSSWVLLLVTDGAGFLPIVVVILATVSVYVVRWPGTAAVIAGNTVVLAVASWLQQPRAAEIIMGVSLYLLLQIGTALSTVTLLREQRMRRELAAAHVELQATTLLLAESTRTAERLRISRDLHDSVGHQLTVLSLELEAARHSAPAAAHDHVERASGVARQVLGDLRSTVGDLRDTDDELAATLRGIVDGVPGLDIELTVDDRLVVGEDARAALVRAVQEVVTNTLRHAEATTLGIAVSADEHGVTLQARDDGRGSRRLQPGHGLLGMVERFEALGGAAEFDASDGFAVTARIPA